MVYFGPMTPLFSLFAILASLCGLWAALHIHRTKRAKKKLVCSLQANCDKVVHSIHATTFGIPNELLGIGYYVVIGSLHALTVLYPSIFAVAGVYYVIFLATLGGVLFSLYLVALQAIVIRAWCTWCLISALANIILGLCLLGLPMQGLIPLFAGQRTAWILIHSIGFILGVGAATITDIFFFKFLKHHQITQEEKGILDTLTSVIWAALATLVVSGLILFLSDSARLGSSPKFLLKVVAVLGIVVNGVLLNLFVAPRMRLFSFEGTKPARRLRRLAFALGAISITSWYSAFVLGSLRHIGEYSFTEGLIGYGALLGLVVIGSQLFERVVVRHYHAIAVQQSAPTLETEN